MKKYLQKNSQYWQSEYKADNVESYIFRVYGRIFAPQFSLDGSNHEKLLDFGCGSGSALEFFKSKGFDVYGVDISKWAIKQCKRKMPDIADQFAVIDELPDEKNIFFPKVQYDLVISIQALYYLSDSDLKKCLTSIYNQMKKGAIFYATMMGTQTDWFYNNSVAYQDGLRKIKFNMGRIQIKDYYLNFTKDENDLLQKFSMFKKIHIGFYSQKFREDEGTGFHYTFIGQKV